MEFLDIALESVLQLLSVPILGLLALFPELFDEAARLILLLALLVAHVESIRPLLLNCHDLDVLDLLQSKLAAFLLAAIVLKELV